MKEITLNQYLEISRADMFEAMSKDKQGTRFDDTEINTRNPNGDHIRIVVRDLENGQFLIREKHWYLSQVGAAKSAYWLADDLNEIMPTIKEGRDILAKLEATKKRLPDDWFDDVLADVAKEGTQ